MKNSEINRLLHNLCRLGTIAELDYAAKKVRIQTGELKTDWLNWPADVGNNYVRFKPLRLNTQVIILCLSGDISQGQIVGTLYSDEMVAPGDSEELDIIKFEDGTEIQYDSSESKLSITCVGDVELNANNITATSQGNATIEAKGNAEVFAAGNTKIEATGMAEIKATQIKLNDGAAGGVVCQSHVCSFTGGPHPQASTTIIASN